MKNGQHIAPPREVRVLGRARRARRWAWFAALSLGICALFAIWQERALAPGVHDGMQRVVAQAEGMMDGTGTVRALLARWGGGVDVARDTGLDPVTALLLRAAM